MCSISGIFGPGAASSDIRAMVRAQAHRGPDGEGVFEDPSGAAVLGHGRLAIIDLSPSARQPMSSADGRYWIAFNGEIYNYLELRRELDSYPYRSRSDTEVVLAAYERWGPRCLDRFLGMFAFLLWDRREQALFAARDRFGVKPLYYHLNPQGRLSAASEVKALHAAGVPAGPDQAAWAQYLKSGLHDHGEGTFWEGIWALPPGSSLSWRRGRLEVSRWYDAAERAGPELDARPEEEVRREYWELLKESVRLRFRSDVPVGINLSGGLDSSLLLALVREVQGEASRVRAFTFVTGNPAYDELLWVEKMLASTRHPLSACRLNPEDVPALALSVQEHADGPYGGLPTLAYARLFERARAEGVVVLLDAQGMDEQWAGYDYYGAALAAPSSGPLGNVFGPMGPAASTAPLVQGTKDSPVRPECLEESFRALAPAWAEPAPFPDRLRNLQYRDLRHSKIPRALRFNDRVSMRAGTELREPFLDHRLVELALRQPADRKIRGSERKWLLRRLAEEVLPPGLAQAPKRPLQTPQREWLRGPLREWAGESIEAALRAYGGTWLKRDKVLSAWRNYCAGEGDNSFYVWQWISLGLMAGSSTLSKESHA